MELEDIFGIVVASIGVLLLSATFGKIYGVSEGVELAHKEAITVGVARWIPDKEGNPKFEWIKPPEKKVDEK